MHPVTEVGLAVLALGGEAMAPTPVYSASQTSAIISVASSAVSDIDAVSDITYFHSYKLMQRSEEKSVLLPKLPYELPASADMVLLGAEKYSPEELWSAPAPIIFTLPQDEQEDPVEDSGTPIIVEGKALDTIDEFSLETYEVVDAIDQAVVEPMVDFYTEAVPSPIRQASQNFLRNLGEPVNFLNYLLQLKPGKAVETAGRFLINSTLGIGGLIDVAGMPGINLPYKYNGFANTLGYYGVKQGRYLYLPLVGATTPRDLFGNTVDRVLIPVIYGSPFDDPVFAITAGAVSALNQRVANDEMIDRIRRESADPFGDTRDAYLELREREINELRGLVPDDDIDRQDEESENSNKTDNLPATEPTR